jgi:hypothetical protein
MDLGDKLDSLLRRCAAAREEGAGEQWLEHLRKDLRRLIAEYGPNAVDAALDRLEDAQRPSSPLH